MLMLHNDDKKMSIIVDGRTLRFEGSQALDAAISWCFNSCVLPGEVLVLDPSDQVCRDRTSEFSMLLRHKWSEERRTKDEIDRVFRQTVKDSLERLTRMLVNKDQIP